MCLSVLLLTPVLFFLMMQITLIWPWAQWNRLKPSPSPALSPCFWVSYGTWQVCIPVCLCVCYVFMCGAHRVRVLGDVEEIEISEKSTLRVFNGITVVHDQNMVLLEVRRHTGHSHTSVTMATEVTRVWLCVCFVLPPVVCQSSEWHVRWCRHYSGAGGTVQPESSERWRPSSLTMSCIEIFPSFFLYLPLLLLLFLSFSLPCALMHSFLHSFFLSFYFLSPFVAFFLSFSWFWWLPLFVSFLCFLSLFSFFFPFDLSFTIYFLFQHFFPPIFSTF